MAPHLLHQRGSVWGPFGIRSGNVRYPFGVRSGSFELRSGFVRDPFGAGTSSENPLQPKKNRSPGGVEGGAVAPPSQRPIWLRFSGAKISTSQNLRNAVKYWDPTLLSLIGLKKFDRFQELVHRLKPFSLKEPLMLTEAR